MREFIPGGGKEEKTRDTTSSSSFDLILDFPIILSQETLPDTPGKEKQFFPDHTPHSFEERALDFTFLVYYLDFILFVSLPCGPYYPTYIFGYNSESIQTLSEFVKNFEIQLLTNSSTESIALLDSSFARRVCTGVRVHLLILKLIWLHFPPSASSHLGALHLSWRWRWNYLRKGGIHLSLGTGTRRSLIHSL